MKVYIGQIFIFNNHCSTGFFPLSNIKFSIAFEITIIRTNSILSFIFWNTSLNGKYVHKQAILCSKLIITQRTVMPNMFQGNNKAIRTTSNVSSEVSLLCQTQWYCYETFTTQTCEIRRRYKILRVTSWRQNMMEKYWYF